MILIKEWKKEQKKKSGLQNLRPATTTVSFPSSSPLPAPAPRSASAALRSIATLASCTSLVLSSVPFSLPSLSASDRAASNRSSKASARLRVAAARSSARAARRERRSLTASCSANSRARLPNSRCCLFLFFLV